MEEYKKNVAQAKRRLAWARDLGGPPGVQATSLLAQAGQPGSSQNISQSMKYNAT